MIASRPGDQFEQAGDEEETKIFRLPEFPSNVQNEWEARREKIRQMLPSKRARRQQEILRDKAVYDRFGESSIRLLSDKEAIQLANEMGQRNLLQENREGLINIDQNTWIDYCREKGFDPKPCPYTLEEVRELITNKQARKEKSYRFHGVFLTKDGYPIACKIKPKALTVPTAEGKTDQISILTMTFVDMFGTIDPESAGQELL